MRKGKGHYGSGSIDRSGENSWRIRYRLNGVRYTKVVEGSKTEAAKELRRLLHTGDSGQHVAPDRITLGQWVTDWLALKKRSIKPLTYERYEGILTQHVVPVLGAIPLQKITAPDVDKLYTGLAFGPSTAQLLHIVLKSCFASAAKKKLRADNPVADAEKPSGEARTDEIILDEDELGRLVQGFRGHSIYLIVAVAAFTGMRRNEILALRWVDVDLNAGMITVCRNVEQTKAHGRRIGTPKSKAGHRTFQIDPGLVDRLRKERDLALRIVAGIPDGVEVDLSLVRLPGEALVCPALGADLTAIRGPAGVSNAFFTHARRLGFQDISLHDLRASHETALLDKGVPVHVVAKRCGHDPAMLLRVYARRTKKADANAANVIGTLMKGVL
jgi:integrase